MEVVVFWFAAFLAIGGAVGVVLLRNPFYSVLSLVVHLVALAALFLLLQAEFVAAAQVIVYAGAVMVLYVFVVAYVGGLEDPLMEPNPALRVAAPLFALALLIELCVAFVGSGLKAIDSEGPDVAGGFGSPEQIGELFLTKFLIPFEVVSLLLLVAAVGALVLAKRTQAADPQAGTQADDSQAGTQAADLPAGRRVAGGISASQDVPPAGEAGVRGT